MKENFKTWATNVKDLIAKKEENRESKKGFLLMLFCALVGSALAVCHFTNWLRTRKEINRLNKEIDEGLITF